MPPACAMAIAICALGDGIHRRGDDRHIERDRAGDAGADIDFGGQNFGQAGLDQHVVEGECFARGCRYPSPFANSVRPGALVPEW